MPNPFYQIYEGAALMAGCRPALYAIDEDADGNLDAISDASWDACQMIYVCTPGNPTGAVLSEAALQQLLAYRTYHGCSMSGFVAAASIAAWSDETHVAANRAAYDQSYQAVIERLSPVLEVSSPPAGFYLWPRLPIDDETFTQQLLATQHVRVVPGSYLARDAADGSNPGKNRIRMALVASPDRCAEAADRIASMLHIATASSF